MMYMYAFLASVFSLIETGSRNTKSNLLCTARDSTKLNRRKQGKKTFNVNIGKNELFVLRFVSFHFII